MAKVVLIIAIPLDLNLDDYEDGFDASMALTSEISSLEGGLITLEEVAEMADGEVVYSGVVVD